MNPESLTLYKCPYQVQRIGKSNDGGYVIAHLPVTYDLFLAGGIERDISFENDFVRMFPQVKCIAYDGTICSLPHDADPRIRFVRKNIGFVETEAETNLHAEIAGCVGDIFVKMDIEGGEIPWLESLSRDQMERFAQIVMEFHNPMSEREGKLFDKINETHVLVHFHGNNCAHCVMHGGIVMPVVFECTYIHRRFYTGELTKNTEPVPTPIDMPNSVYTPDIVLNYPPFVHSA